MVVFESLDSIGKAEEAAIALGNFDGVHLGHQALIGKTVRYAWENGLKAAVFTFSTHPKNLLPGQKPVKNILYQNEKEQIMESLGVDILYEIPFTEEIMRMPPEEFVRKLLVEKMNMKAGFSGFNYHFGYKAGGNAALLREMGKELGYTSYEMPPFMVGEDVVSSTLIRTLIASGRVDRCYEYMGRNYQIAGEVVVGNKLGRTLGFPTSNLIIDESMVTPPNGVYVTYCNYNGVRYPSVTNVGVKPTIGEYKKNVETHIFDFDRILYGKTITVEFLLKTRDEVKFDSVEDLSEQILRDCREAKHYHEKIGK